jgi:hypothetical protein
MKIPSWVGVLILFSLFLIGLYAIWGDKNTDPVITTNSTTNITTVTCPDKYNLIQNEVYESNQTVQNYTVVPDPAIPGKYTVISTEVAQPAVNRTVLSCFKEGTTMRVKVTFLNYLAIIFILGSMVLFLASFMQMDKSSVVAYYKNRFTGDKPVCKCPDIGHSCNYIWTHKGYDRIVSQTENEIHIAKESMSTPEGLLGRNLLFKGEAEILNPKELFEYIGRNAQLFYDIMGEPIKNYDIQAVFDGAPRIFYPKPMKNSEKEAFYSRVGNYGFNSDRFDYVINMLFELKNGITTLSVEMHDDMKGMMKKGEDYIASGGRMRREAGKHKKTEQPETRYEPETNGKVRP